MITFQMIGMFLVLGFLGMCVAAVIDAAEPAIGCIGIVFLIVIVIKIVDCFV